jgi:hypothetical protein
MGTLLIFLSQQSLLLLLLPHLVKVQLLVTRSLNEVERGRIGRRNHQPLPVMLGEKVQSLLVILAIGL